jgi:hypothetical protein
VANPYPAEFWGPSRDTRALVVRLGGFVNFTDPSNQPGGGGSLEVTDGVHTVAAATELDFTSGATVTDLGAGVAGIAIAGGGATLSSFPFTFATASLAAGVNTGISAVAGKGLVFATLQIATSFDGTTPQVDFGVGVGAGGAGIAGLIQSVPFDATHLDTPSAGIIVAQSVTAPGVWASSGPIQMWLNQTGLKGGAASGSSVGAATLYVLQTS